MDTAARAATGPFKLVEETVYDVDTSYLKDLGYMEDGEYDEELDFAENGLLVSTSTPVKSIFKWI